MSDLFFHSLFRQFTHANVLSFSRARAHTRTHANLEYFYCYSTEVRLKFCYGAGKLAYNNIIVVVVVVFILQHLLEVPPLCTVRAFYLHIVRSSSIRIGRI